MQTCCRTTAVAQLAIARILSLFEGDLKRNFGCRAVINALQVHATFGVILGDN